MLTRNVMPSRALNFWRNIVFRDRIEIDLDDELRSHLELLTDEKIQQGLSRGPLAVRR